MSCVYWKISVGIVPTRPWFSRRSEVLLQFFNAALQRKVLGEPALEIDGKHALLIAREAALRDGEHVDRV